MWATQQHDKDKKKDPIIAQKPELLTDWGAWQHFKQRLFGLHFSDLRAAMEESSAELQSQPGVLLIGKHEQAPSVWAHGLH